MNYNDTKHKLLVLWEKIQNNTEDIDRLSSKNIYTKTINYIKEKNEYLIDWQSISNETLSYIIKLVDFPEEYINSINVIAIFKSLPIYTEDFVTTFETSYSGADSTKSYIISKVNYAIRKTFSEESETEIFYLLLDVSGDFSNGSTGQAYPLSVKIKLHALNLRDYNEIQSN